MRRLDIGVASYGASEKLRRTLSSIQKQSVTDWRCFVIDNPGPDPKTRPLIERMAAEDNRIIAVMMDENVGYAGAVNKLMELAETEYLGYCDNDIRIETHGWDEVFCRKLDQYHEIGIIFPSGGAYQIDRGQYQEIMWGVGFCWMLNRLAMSDVGGFDESLGHQDECDYALRLRMAGYKCAALPEVKVKHDATATSNPASIERINRGVVKFVNKWCQYFCGKDVNYHSTNVLRWEDWPPNALYLEQWWKTQLPGLNDAPEEWHNYDFIRVPRLKGFYRGRVI